MSSAKKVKKVSRRRHDINFEIHVYKVLKQVHPDTGITRSTLKQVDQMARGVGRTIILRAMDLVRLNEGSTITSRDIQSAVRSVLPGEIAKHAVSEGTKAVTKFNANLAGSVTPRGAKKGRHSSSMSSRAGLTFSVARAKRLIKNLSFGARVGMGAPIYLAAVLEYLTAEILELAGNAARDNKKVRVNRRHIMLAVRYDEELIRLYKDYVFPGGVIPHIHSVVLAAIVKGSKKEEQQSF